jgi:hypothetical protein
MPLAAPVMTATLLRENSEGSSPVVDYAYRYLLLFAWCGAPCLAISRARKRSLDKGEGADRRLKRWSTGRNNCRVTREWDSLSPGRISSVFTRGAHRDRLRCGCPLRLEALQHGPHTLDHREVPSTWDTGLSCPGDGWCPVRHNRLQIRGCVGFAPTSGSDRGLSSSHLCGRLKSAAHGQVV